MPGPRSNREFHPPSQIEEYRVLNPLGRGGMGEVYLGHDILLDRAVAIKFIRNGDAPGYSKIQFLTEARASARLSHPNVVAVYRVGEIEGNPFIVSEYVRGQNLDRVKLPLPWQKVLEIGIGLARGLGAAHRRGVLHRDIKPGNIMLPNEGEVKLLDFGLAKFVEALKGIEVTVEDRVEPRITNVPTMDVPGAGRGSLSPSSAPRPVTPAIAPRMTMPGKPMQSRAGAEGPMRVIQLSDDELADQTPLPTDLAREMLAAKALAPTPPSMEGIAPVDPAIEPTASLEVPNLVAELPPLKPVADTTSGIKGTPLYMSPEVLNGEPATRRSDVYSMGAVLFELCVGTPPHYSPLLKDLIRLVNTNDAPPLTRVVTGIDPRFAAVIARCLSRNPSERYASGEELREALEQLVESGRKETLPEGNPYRGLLPFEAEHRALFFGRKTEIGTLVDRLRTEVFVLVTADSGVGKSSLCRAGVLPAIADGALGGGRTWLQAVMVPGRQPLTSLALALVQAFGAAAVDEVGLVNALKSEPDRLPRELQKLLGDGRGLTLFVDQMEELVTIGDPAQAAALGDALAALIVRPGAVRLVGTVRSDFLARLASVPGIGDEVSRALYILRPLTKERIREAVVGPAQKKGVSFESEELVNTLVGSIAKMDGGLPLLQFALAELWEARSGDSISTLALDSIGGVTGALARHADHVIGALRPEHRNTARRILMALVTLEGTRARRTETELTREGAPARAALEALVRGRLLVARDTPEGPIYEVAHEALIKGWDTLRRWLEEYAESRAVKHRLDAATADWFRLGKPKDLLWTAQQLAEVAIVEAVEIGEKEAEFLAASRRRASLRKRLRQALILSAPLLLIGLYGAVRITAARDLSRRINAALGQAQQLRTEAAQKDAEVEKLRADALRLFDSKQRDDAEKIWAQALAKTREVDKSYARAGQSLEAALSIDGSRTDIRALLGDVLYARALVAEREYASERLDDMLQRMSLYDADGSRRARWATPGTVRIESEPPGAAVRIERYTLNSDGKYVLGDSQDWGGTPIAERTLAQGSYLLSFQLAGRYPVRYPFVLSRGETLNLRIPLLREAQVPKNMAYVPPGRFLFGAAGEEGLRKSFYNTVPLHRVQSEGFLISLNELTYAEYIEFLDALPPKQRTELLPQVGSGISGSVSLKYHPKHGWQLSLKPVNIEQTVGLQQPVVFPSRTRRQSQDWRRFPVSGISAKLVEAYVRWLSESKRVPGARLCTEMEWEYASRGADGRSYAAGEALDLDDLNYYDTYGDKPNAQGPDEVGAHPSSRSPFGLFDTSGNLFELNVSSLKSEEFVMRGGSYMYDKITGLLMNRNVTDIEHRDADTGTRICATIDPAK